MIIKSLMDNDFYTITVMQVVLHHYPATHVRYGFKWRNFDKMRLRIPIEDFAGRLKKEIAKFCDLEFTKDELNYLKSIEYVKPDFIEYLRLFKPNVDYVRVSTENGELKITVEGPWVSTIIFEVPILAMVSQLYTENSNTSKAIWLPEARKRLQAKLSMLDSAIHSGQPFSFSDFGTRRRADGEWHEEAVAYARDKYGRLLAGTSNMGFAMKYGLRLIGTMSHQYLQAFQQLGPRLFDFQKVALQTWADEYRGNLGIALSDVIGFRAFMKDFDKYFAKLFDGCRHDSGDPVWWCENLIEHYKRLRIDPKTKHAVFSDGLTFEIAIDLFRRFHTQINTGFGIGTYFTNDCGFLAPQIVIKLVECLGRPVAKVPDSVGKGMCEDPEFEHWLRRVIEDKIKGS
jgi:nicotinate phosphoribosyltransferase